jgi:hypothetical protein
LIARRCSEPGGPRASAGSDLSGREIDEETLQELERDLDLEELSPLSAKS